MDVLDSGGGRGEVQCILAAPFDGRERVALVARGEEKFPVIDPESV